MDNKIFRKWNLAVGAVVFAISAFTYEEIAANGPEPALQRLRTLLN